MDRNKARETFIFCLGVVLLCAFVQAAGWLKQDRLVFPDIGEIGRAFLRLLGDGATWLKMWITLRHLLISLGLSTLIAVPLGLAEGMSRTVRGLLRPTMIVLRSLPMIVLVVIIMVLTHYSRVPVAATSLMLMPIISEAVAEGCLRLDRELMDVWRLESALRPAVLLRVHLPLMGGYLRQAYVSAIGMGIKMVVSTEYLVQTRDSLGKAVYTAAYFNEYAEIYAWALIMLLLVLLLSGVPGLVWRRPEEAPD